MDPSSFPKKYGGELEWEWGNMPDLDEPARALIGPLERIGELGDKEDPGKDSPNAERSFIKGPAAWNDNKMMIYGTVKGEARRRVIQPDVDPSELVPQTTSKPNGVAANPQVENEKATSTGQESRPNGVSQASA